MADINKDIKIDEDGWEIVEDLSNAFGVVTIESDDKSDLDLDDKMVEGFYEDYDYEEEDGDIEEELTPIESIQSSQLGISMSYKDALKSSKRASSTHITEKQNIPPNYRANYRSQTMKPIIQVKAVPYIRQDREYGQRPQSYVDDYEDEGMWDLIYSQMDNKLTAAASRYRSRTMLTPSQAATKASRVAQKG